MWCCPASGVHWFGCVSGGPRCSRSRSIKGSCRMDPNHFYMHSTYFKGCIHIRTPSLYMYMYVYIYIYMCVCALSLSLSLVYIHIHILYIYIYTYIYTCSVLYVYLYICVCIVYVCICICMCICMCMCTYAYVYLYVYVYESWFFIKCTVCLNQYQPSCSGGVFPANVSMGHRKTIQDGQVKRCGPLLWNHQSTSMH